MTVMLKLHSATQYIPCLMEEGFIQTNTPKDGSTLIGAIVDKSENKYGLAGGTDFGPLASIWLLDTDRGKLTIGTNDYGIDIFEGCELAREEE